MSLFSLPNNPVPDGAVSGEITAADGVRLRYARWMPDSGLKGTVAVFPGRAEFIEKYFEVVRELRSRGFAVAILDWRGQGGSQRLVRNPLKGHVRHFRDYQLDLEAFARDVLLPDCPAPHFALAHSMAGTILLQSVLAGRRWFDRMVLAGPLLGIKIIPAQRLVRALVTALAFSGFARAFVPGARGIPITEVPFARNPVNSDPERYARAAEMVRAFPQLGVGAPTNGWLYAAYRAMDTLADPEVVRQIRQPLLMVAAGGDRLVSNAAIEHLSARLIAGAHVVVPAAQHEILMERDLFRAQFWAAFDAFIPGTPVV